MHKLVKEKDEVAKEREQLKLLLVEMRTKFESCSMKKDGERKKRLSSTLEQVGNH